jgi:hypothetical protein
MLEWRGMRGSRGKGRRGLMSLIWEFFQVERGKELRGLEGVRYRSFLIPPN